MSDLLNDALADEEANALKLTVMRKAAELVAAEHPLSATSQAACRALSTIQRGVITVRGDHTNDPKPVADLIGAIREVIRKDPDYASSWALALSDLLEIHGKLTDPRRWRPSLQQVELARSYIDPEEGECLMVEFDGEGRLIARREFGGFHIIPQEPGDAISPSARGGD